MYIYIIHNQDIITSLWSGSYALSMDYNGHTGRSWIIMDPCHDETPGLAMMMGWDLRPFCYAWSPERLCWKIVQLHWKWMNMWYYWDNIGIILGYYWDNIGIIVGNYWDKIIIRNHLIMLVNRLQIERGSSTRVPGKGHLLKSPIKDGKTPTRRNKTM